MADNKLVKEITSMDEDFAKWYTDICIKAELIDYSSVRGCMVIRPYGYAIWELIQAELDKRLATAEWEFLQADKFDYVIENNDLDVTVDMVRKILNVM